jgi:exopolysaccharide biosynthesis polyprenyl glycosylphosphotransferase
MKRSELLISTLLVPLDAAMIFAAFILSYYTRVESGALPVSNVLSFHEFARAAVGVTAVWLVIFALLGLYSLKATRRGLTEFSRIFAGVTVGTLASIALIFFLRIDFFSRLVVVFAFVAALVLVVTARAIVRGIQRGLFRYGIGVRRTMIIGTGRPARLLAEELSRRGYHILGHVRTGRRTKTDVSLEILGALGDLPGLLAGFQPDELICAEPALSDQQVTKVIATAEEAHVELRLTTNVAELASSNLEVSAVAGIPLVTIQRTPLDGWGRVTKRATDIVGAAVALPFVAILYPFVALAIKLDSRGPVIFKQTRVGRAGQEFTSYKFRTMSQDAERRLKQLQKRNEATGPVFKIKHDPRITRVGRFLRQSSLDELPQFWNVLLGDMSLVGPRPPLPVEVAKYDRAAKRRLTIKPGITGPWQVSGRSNVGFEEWVRLDVYYIQNWSLLLDVTILLKTVVAVVTRKGAY